MKGETGSSVMTDRVFLQPLFLQPPALNTPLYTSPRRCAVGGFGVWGIGCRVNGLGGDNDWENWYFGGLANGDWGARNGFGVIR